MIKSEKSEKLAVGEGAQKPSVPEGENKLLNQSEKSREQCHHSVCLGCEVGGPELVEVLPVLLFLEKGEQQVMDITKHLWMKNWLSHLTLEARR